VIFLHHTEGKILHHLKDKKHISNLYKIEILKKKDRKSMYFRVLEK